MNSKPRYSHDLKCKVRGNTGSTLQTLFNILPVHMFISDLYTMSFDVLLMSSEQYCCKIKVMEKEFSDSTNDQH